uniref:Uncharacterized protein n=1 Tax=Moniliophthora roreri TaxID=221103 RepID=A0A0W0GC34_MONRR
MPEGSERVCWKGEGGSELHMCLPTIVTASGDNSFEPVATYLKNIVQTPFVEHSNNFILCIEHHEIPEDPMDLLLWISEALANNHIVHLVGYIPKYSMPMLGPIIVHSLQDNILYYMSDGKGG